MKKIAFISQPEYFRFVYEDYLNDLFETKEFPFKYNMKEDEFDDLVEYEADYNFFFRGEFFPPLALKRLKGVKIALSSEPFPRKIDGKWAYTLDSIKRYLAFRRIREQSFDYVFHYEKSSLPLFEKDGLVISDEFVFPVAVDTYKPIHKEKMWDLFFIGRSSLHREKLFLPLKHHFHFLHIAHGIWGGKLVNYINKSKICLNVHAEPEISWEPRIQMMLACGAFVISEKITPNTYLRPGIEYIEFSGEQDLYDKVSFYLHNDTARERVVANAQRRIMEIFDSKKRFAELINDLEEGKYQRFSATGRGNLGIHLIDKMIRFFR